MPRHILTIDQGTTGSTVSIYNSFGQVVAKSEQDFPQIYPKPGWVEHDPEEIWKSVLGPLREVLSKANVGKSGLAGIGITNQRETVVLWDRKTGKPLHHAIVWQCRRTTEFCEKLKKRPAAVKAIKNKTGLVVDPYFSASKIRWLLDHVPGAKAKVKKGELAVGTIDSFLVWRLTGGKVHVTDVSNASRTQLMNIKTGAWDPELLRIFGIPKEILPEIRSSSEVYGATNGVNGLPDGVPVAGIAGDQQSALFGQACFKVGEAKCTYGTGSFILVNSGYKMPQSKSGVLTTVAWKLGPKDKITYALEGSAFICGAAVQWLRDGLGIISSSKDIEGLARSVDDAGGVEFVPALTGLGAPYWDPEARGVICGLTRGTTKHHLARATLEGMAMQNADLVTAMQKDLGKKISKIKVDGGASENKLLMQLQSNYLGIPLIRPANVETTSTGAAFLAGLAVGVWKSPQEIQKIWEHDFEFKPKMSTKERTARFLSWKKAVSKAATKPIKNK